MRNDINYKLLTSLNPAPAPEDIIRILVDFNFKSVSGLSRKTLRSHTSINRVLKGENLPEVRREILKALDMTIDPWEKT